LREGDPLNQWLAKQEGHDDDLNAGTPTVNETLIADGINNKGTKQ